MESENPVTRFGSKKIVYNVNIHKRLAKEWKKFHSFV